MDAKDAIEKINLLKGVDLHSLAAEYEVTFTNHQGNINKGWAGHSLEKYLGLTTNSSQSPDFITWELKVVPIKKLGNGVWTYKETMAVTMINPVEVSGSDFESSHLLNKLKSFVLVIRTVGDSAQAPSFIHQACAIHLSKEIYSVVREDYESVRQCIADPDRGFSYLTGKMGTYIQPRTKGAGHGSTSRAFYARQKFLHEVAPLGSQSKLYDY